MQFHTTGWSEELCKQAPLEPSAVPLWFISKAVTTTWVSEQKLSGAKTRAKEVMGKMKGLVAGGTSHKSQGTTEVTSLLQQPEVDKL